MLTITLAQGGELSGIVNDRTEIECDDQGEDETGDDRMARASHDGGDDGSGDDHACTTATLTAGAVVSEAELEAVDGKSYWQTVELLG